MINTFQETGRGLEWLRDPFRAEKREVLLLGLSPSPQPSGQRVSEGKRCINWEVLAKSRLPEESGGVWVFVFFLERGKKTFKIINVSRVYEVGRLGGSVG